MDVPSQRFKNFRMHGNAVANAFNTEFVCAVADYCQNIFIGISGIDNGHVYFKIRNTEVIYALKSFFAKLVRDILPYSLFTRADVSGVEYQHISAALGIFQKRLKAANALR